MELRSIEPLITPNSVTLFRGYDSVGQRWSFHPADERRPENWYCSTTGVLDIFAPRQLKEWWIKTAPEEIQKKSGAAMKRGNEIHKAIAEGKKPKSVADRLEVQYSEVSVYSPTYGFAGTIDTVGLLDGEPVILDYKSGRNYGIKTGYQLAAYRLAWKELTGEERGLVGVHIPPGRENQKVLIYEHLEFVTRRFLYCFEIWKAFNFNQLRKFSWRWLLEDSAEQWLKDQVVEVAG